MPNLFDVIPPNFFNCLSSSSNSRIYADCLEVLYEEYSSDVSYRAPRVRIRDAIAGYLLENHVNLAALSDDETAPANATDAASAILRRFCSKEVGWLEEENEDRTYEKYLVMTEAGLRLAEFIGELKRPEKEEYASYIFAIRNTLKNRDQWDNNPYVYVLKDVFHNAKLLAKSLKALSTFIRKIIERLVREETLESLTNNLITYCDGDFIREYSRLTKQQNIHIYRRFILDELDRAKDSRRRFAKLVDGCREEEGLDDAAAAEKVLDLIAACRQFLTEDYDRIMRNIKENIKTYLTVAVARARFLQNRNVDARGNVEQTVRILVEEMKELDFKDELPLEMRDLFQFARNDMIARDSIRFPRKEKAIRTATVEEYRPMTQKDIEEARQLQEEEAFNPYSKDLMKAYLEEVMDGRTSITAEDLPLESVRDLLCALSAAAYAQQNGFGLKVLEDYFETHSLILHNFRISTGKEDK